jgi:hypothetical protein
MRHALLVGLLLALPLVASPAQAASLTLGCSGTATTTHLPKNGMASDPEKDSVVDMSVVVNFDERTVSGFLLDEDASGRYFQKPLPIETVDANGVSFRGNSSNKNSPRSSVFGTVDRITGKIDATGDLLWSNGTLRLGTCAVSPPSRCFRCGGKIMLIFS